MVQVSIVNLESNYGTGNISRQMAFDAINFQTKYDAAGDCKYI
jgi:hypothetical protein